MMTTERAATGRDAATAPGPTGSAHGYCGRCGWGPYRNGRCGCGVEYAVCLYPLDPASDGEQAIGTSPLTGLPVNPREPIR